MGTEIMDKSVRKIARKAAARPALTVRSPAAKPSTRAPSSEMKPRLSRVTSNLDVVVPRDCRASVILTQVAHDAKYNYYSIWLVAGRYEEVAMTTKCKYRGEDMIRCD